MGLTAFLLTCSSVHEQEIEMLLRGLCADKRVLSERLGCDSDQSTRCVCSEIEDGVLGMCAIEVRKFNPTFEENSFSFSTLKIFSRRSEDETKNHSVSTFRLAKFL